MPRRFEYLTAQPITLGERSLGAGARLSLQLDPPGVFVDGQMLSGDSLYADLVTLLADGDVLPLAPFDIERMNGADPRRAHLQLVR